MNDNTPSIFDEVQDTEAPQTQGDPTRQLYLLPQDFCTWFLPKDAFGKPKEIKQCTQHIVARFLSWQIAPESVPVYMGTGVAAAGTLRNQAIVRYHSIPDGFLTDVTGRARVPCMLQFGESCPWCAQKTLAEKRFPRDKQPPDYFKRVIAPFKPKDNTFVLFQLWARDEQEKWVSDGKVYAMEFPNYMKNGSTFREIIDRRANEADKRLRIHKPTYAGYTAPVAIRLTFSWPAKEGKPDGDKFAHWTLTDAVPFPVEAAGGPDVSNFTKEWAASVAKHDPAAWINKAAFPKVNPKEVGEWLWGVFDGKIQPAQDLNLDTADLGQLLSVIEKHKPKFDAAGVNPADFDYSMTDALRAIVKGVLNG